MWMIITTCKLVLTVLGHFWWPGSNNNNNYWTEKHNSKNNAKAKVRVRKNNPALVCLALLQFREQSRSYKDIQYNMKIREWKKICHMTRKESVCSHLILTVLSIYRESHMNLYVYSFLLMQGWRNHWSWLYLAINLTYKYTKQGNW